VAREWGTAGARGSRMGALTLAPQVRPPPPRSCLVLLVHGGAGRRCTLTCTRRGLDGLVLASRALAPVRREVMRWLDSLRWKAYRYVMTTNLLA
jgi:hypothetical protein